ncbi:MAG: hypothetical protein II247_01815 [Lachnospiraceae bacterium]|nr:hypothetical protein [Lachnospiraceae bacterium]
MQKKSFEHDFYCTRCANKGIPVRREPGKCKEAGHLKKLYCLYCKEETNHAECVEYSKYDHRMFLLEYRTGNFDTEGNRVLPFSRWKEKYFSGGGWRIEDGMEEIYDVFETRTGTYGH